MSKKIKKEKIKPKAKIGPRETNNQSLLESGVDIDLPDVDMPDVKMPEIKSPRSKKIPVKGQKPKDEKEKGKK